MLIVSYDFSNDKTRAQFAKFLLQYGNRIQYSVFTIRNSSRILKAIVTEVDLTFKKKFGKTDSIVIFRICKKCKQDIIRYGSAKHEEVDVVRFA